MKKFLKGEKGSILIESIVGISLVTVGILGIITLLSRSIGFYDTAVDQTKATYLAAEGIEMIRNAVNANYANGSNFDKNLSDGWYDVSFNSDAPRYLGSAKPDLSGVNPITFAPNNPSDPSAGGVYYAPMDRSRGVNSIFKRLVYIQEKEDTEINSAKAYYYLDVQSEVSWMEKGSMKNVIIEDRFYDWRS